jgi:hypothetical protein
MRQHLVRLTTAATIAVGVAFFGSTVADAQTVMKVCGDQWKAAKAAGTTNGETWPQFLAQCRAQQSGSATAPAAPVAPAPAAPAPTNTQAAAAGGMTTSQCDAQYAANKAAIKASGQTKREFVAACRAGNATIPQGTAAAPPPAAPAAAPAPAPAPANYSSTAATPTRAGEFSTAQQAQNRCPSDTVVWVNTKSRVYHFSGTHDYGNTKHGAYMCEADAKAGGDRAAMNEHHP